MMRSSCKNTACTCTMHVYIYHDVLLGCCTCRRAPRQCRSPPTRPRSSTYSRTLAVAQIYTCEEPDDDGSGKEAAGSSMQVTGLSYIRTIIFISAPKCRIASEVPSLRRSGAMEPQEAAPDDEAWQCLEPI